MKNEIVMIGFNAFANGAGIAFYSDGTTKIFSAKRIRSYPN